MISQSGIWECPICNAKIVNCVSVDVDHREWKWNNDAFEHKNHGCAIKKE